VDKKHKIYQRNETVARPALVLGPRDTCAPARGHMPWTPAVATAGQGEMVAGLERLLLDHYAPAWIVINAQGEAMYFSPRTGSTWSPARAGQHGRRQHGAQGPAPRPADRHPHGAEEGRGGGARGRGRGNSGEVQRINLIVRPITEAGTEPACT
jgi:hypothetical protein